MRAWRSNRWLVAFSWLFASLTLLALLSQPGATHDEWYHTGNIWCAQGVRASHCSEQVGHGTFTVNFDALDCRQPASHPLECPTEGNGESQITVNTGLYPPLMYWTLSWFVTSNFEFSLLLVRAVSALVVSVTLCLMMWNLPRRHRLVLGLLMLTIFTSTGYYLFATINPSSWSLLGVSTGWLPLHAFIHCEDLPSRRRLALLGLGVLSLLLAAGSRWDAAAYFGFMTVLLAVQYATLLADKVNRVLVTSGILGIVFIALEIFSPFRILYHLQILTKFSEGQPDNIQFLSSNLLQSVWASSRGMGSVPVSSQLDLPGIVLILSAISLGTLAIRTYDPGRRVQTVGVAVGFLVVGLVTAAQVAVTDYRDFGPIEPRYVLPLTSALVGWWFLHGPDDLINRVGKLLHSASIVSTASFALMTFSVAERFVDRQTYTLRLLPEGPDQWWWSWMPIGPNLLMLIAPIFFWFFVRGVTNGLVFKAR